MEWIKASCLISFDEDDQLRLNEDALKRIDDIPDWYGITTVSIVGPGRIGKSSLMNMLVGKDVFQIGSTTTRVTKGIWIYIKLEQNRKIATLYIDVEGFGDPEKKNANESDTKLLLVVCQICDVIMYNIKGVYDYDMLQKLLIVCNMFGRYRKKNQVLSKPVLVSILRDFDLDIPAEPDKELRDLFKNCHEALETFRQVKAVPLAKPTGKKNINNLHNMTDDMLEEDFVKGRICVAEYVRDHARPFCIQSNTNISGKVLTSALRKTVDAVNEEDLRGISQTIPELLKQQNEQRIRSAISTYEENMSKHWPTTCCPETLSSKHEEFLKVAKDEVDQHWYCINDQAKPDMKALEVEIDSIYCKLSREKCEGKLKEVTILIEHKHANGLYSNVDGYEEYCCDMQKTETDFKKLNNLGQEKDFVWKKYRESKHDIEQNIKEQVKHIAQIKQLELDKEAAIEEKEQSILEKEKMAANQMELLRAAPPEKNAFDYAIKGFELANSLATFVSSVNGIVQTKKTNQLTNDTQVAAIRDNIGSEHKDIQSSTPTKDSQKSTKQQPNRTQTEVAAGTGKSAPVQKPTDDRQKSTKQPTNRTQPIPSVKQPTMPIPTVHQSTRITRENKVTVQLQKSTVSTPGQGFRGPSVGLKAGAPISGGFVRPPFPRQDGAK